MSGYPPIPAVAIDQPTPASREGFIATAARAVTLNGRNLAPGEDWPPVLLLQSPDELVACDVGAYLVSDDLKQALGDQVMPSLVVMASAFRAGLSMGVWITDAAAAENRLEAVSLVVVDGDGWVQRMAPIRRRRRRHPIIGAWHTLASAGWDSDDPELAGRLVDGLAAAVRLVNENP